MDRFKSASVRTPRVLLPDALSTFFFPAPPRERSSYGARAARAGEVDLERDGDRERDGEYERDADCDGEWGVVSGCTGAEIGGSAMAAPSSRKVETAASRSQLWLSRKKVASSLVEEVISQKELMRAALWFGS